MNISSKSSKHFHFSSLANYGGSGTGGDGMRNSIVQLFATPETIRAMEFSRPGYWSGWPFPSPGDLPNPGIQPRSHTLQADSLPAEPQRKPKNTGVGSLSLLQRIFPTQESNRSLLHCRQILYQLSYQGSIIKSIPGLF